MPRTLSSLSFPLRSSQKQLAFVAIVSAASLVAVPDDASAFARFMEASEMAERIGAHGRSSRHRWSAFSIGSPMMLKSASARSHRSHAAS